MTMVGDRDSDLVQLGIGGMNAPSHQDQGPDFLFSQEPAPDDPGFGVVLRPPDDRTGWPTYPGDSPVPLDYDVPPTQIGSPPFDVKPWDAVDVFQRAALAFSTGARQVTSNDGPFQIVGRQPGRQAVTLSVPQTYPNVTTVYGVIVGSAEGDLANAGFPRVLNPGDSVTFRTEAPVWVAVIPGNSVGLVQFDVEYNPSEGVIGGQ